MVHRAWHLHGFAPALLEFRPLPGGWFMVVMERLGPEWTMLAELEGAAQRQAREVALQTLSRVHDLDIFGKGR